MTDEGFLRAMLDDPWDAGLLRVYADWLDEQGRGELAAIVRQADGVGAWEIPGRGWFAGLSFPADPRPDARTCRDYMELTRRLATVAGRQQVAAMYCGRRQRSRRRGTGPGSGPRRGAENRASSMRLTGA